MASFLYKNFTIAYGNLNCALVIVHDRLWKFKLRMRLYPRSFSEIINWACVHWNAPKGILYHHKIDSVYLLFSLQHYISCKTV